MAEFVAHGFVRFDGLVPAELNAAFVAEYDRGELSDGFGYGDHRKPEELRGGQPFANFWRDSDGLGRVLRLPQVQGAIRSLAGADPIYDHHALHVVQGGHREGQVWHADNMIDPRRVVFDIQLFYFPHDTPREMGGTLLLPGSQYRHIHISDMGRVRNFRGQLPIVCEAGTVLIAHHGIWHCAQPNLTSERRIMFKVRLNSSGSQQAHWNMDDVEDVESYYAILSHNHAWYGNEHRLELLHRLRAWRYLTGDGDFDLDYYLGRIQTRANQADPAFAE